MLGGQVGLLGTQAGVTVPEGGTPPGPTALGGHSFMGSPGCRRRFVWADKRAVTWGRRVNTGCGRLQSPAWGAGHSAGWGLPGGHRAALLCQGTARVLDSPSAEP